MRSKYTNDRACCSNFLTEACQFQKRSAPQIAHGQIHILYSKQCFILYGFIWTEVKIYEAKIRIRNVHGFAIQ